MMGQMFKSKKSKIILATLIAFPVIGLLASVSNYNSSHTGQNLGSQSTQSVPTVTSTATIVPTQAPLPILTSTTTPTLSNNNYYQNSSGNTVHSPAYSTTKPAGATAVCGDGTYSFSQSRRGTCSHHGGVANWL